MGTAIAIHRYPVKSMQGEALDAADIDSRGIAGDRRWAVVDQATGKVLSAKRDGRLLEARACTTPASVTITLPSGTTLAVADPEIHDALSSWLGRPVRLEPATAEGAGRVYEMQVSAEDPESPVVEIPCPPGTFFDLAAVHVLTTASLRAMTALYPDGAWVAGRFRPTLLVEADGDGFVEDEWVGREVQAGTVGLMPFMPTVRCVVPTRPHAGLPADLGLVKAVNRHHGAALGVYAAVSAPGSVQVGHAVT